MRVLPAWLAFSFAPVRSPALAFFVLALEIAHQDGDKQVQDHKIADDDLDVVSSILSVNIATDLPSNSSDLTLDASEPDFDSSNSLSMTYSLVLTDDATETSSLRCRRSFIARVMLGVQWRIELSLETHFGIEPS